MMKNLASEGRVLLIVLKKLKSTNIYYSKYTLLYLL